MRILSQCQINPFAVLYLPSPYYSLVNLLKPNYATGSSTLSLAEIQNKTNWLNFMHPDNFFCEFAMQQFLSYAICDISFGLTGLIFHPVILSKIL